MKDTTIAALATFPAESAIGIIRISGKDAFRVAASVFKPAKKNFDSIRPRCVCLGFLHDSGLQLDRAMLTLFKGPRSYTGEDMAEFSCHGSPYILDRVMALLLSLGCEPAGPGEFTKRAFLNGKMDLSEAEAVADLISAKTDSALKLALCQLSGCESDAIRKLRKLILGLLSLIEAEIDFAHEDIQKTPPKKASALAENVITQINSLLKNADNGIMLKQGIKTVIAGRPNTGKSSLLNAILNMERAIVTATPGTTRDTVEASASIGGLAFKFIDTAGLRKPGSRAEKLGIKRARSAIASAVAAILVIDGSKKPGPADLAAFRSLKGRHILIAVNKSDLKQAASPAQAARFFSLPAGVPVIQVSAKKRLGIKTLTKTLESIIIKSHAVNTGDILVASLRHKKELLAAKAAMLPAVDALKKGSFEQAAFDIKQAAAHLGRITGEISGEEILDSIFSKFCVGK